MSTSITLPDTVIREITNDGSFVHIPVEQMKEFVLYSDALTLGALCLFIGLALGITVTYLWYRQEQKDGNTPITD